MLCNDGMVKGFLGKKQFVLSFLVQVIVPPDNRALQYNDAEDHQKNDQNLHKALFFFRKWGIRSTNDGFQIERWI
jgi:hypothetical protein